MTLPNWGTAPKAVPTLDELAEQLLHAKALEQDAKAHRIDIEEQIIERVGVKEEGPTNANGERYRLFTAGKITRTLDADAVEALRERIPAPLYNRLFNFLPKLDLKEYRYIRNNEPDYFALLDKAVTSKPAKPTVFVKEID